jgi:histidine triad (HIT) family protein
MDDCPFCAYATGAKEPDGGIEFFDDVMVFRPLRPFVKEHRLVVPVAHVTSIIRASPDVIGAVMWRASREASRFLAANVLTSVGQAATQTVPHWHVHVVPRQAGDRLAGWPWKPADPDRKPPTGGLQIHVSYPARPPEGYSRAHLEEAFEAGRRRGRAGR